MKEIHYEIDKAGNIKHESKGFTGKACDEVLEIMARIGVVSNVMHTPERNKKAEKPAYNELFRKP